MEEGKKREGRRLEEGKEGGRKNDESAFNFRKCWSLPVVLYWSFIIIKV